MRVEPRYEYGPGGQLIVTPGVVEPPDDQRMLNASQVAEELGVSVYKVSRLVRHGDLHVFVTERDRRQRLFDPAEIEALKPVIRRIGNDWLQPDDDNRQALEDVHEQLRARGVSEGYDLQALLNIVEEHQWHWRLEKLRGRPVAYEAELHRPYRPGRASFELRCQAWTPELALARSVAEMLDDRGWIIPREQWSAKFETLGRHSHEKQTTGG
ncbi:MAG: helix-turn-helix domain-containing protein [Thermomicrobiales bacterium]